MKNFMAKGMPLILAALGLIIAGCENAVSPDSGGGTSAKEAAAVRENLQKMLTETSNDLFVSNSEVAFLDGPGTIEKADTEKTTISIPAGVTLRLYNDRSLTLKRSKGTKKPEFTFTGGGTVQLDDENSLIAQNADLVFDGVTIAVKKDGAIQADSVKGRGQLGFRILGNVSDVFEGRGGLTVAGTTDVGRTGQILKLDSGTTYDLEIGGVYTPWNVPTAPAGATQPTQAELKSIRNIKFTSIIDEPKLYLLDPTGVAQGTKATLGQAATISGEGHIYLGTAADAIPSATFSTKKTLSISKGIKVHHWSAAGTPNVIPQLFTGDYITVEDGMTIVGSGGNMNPDTIKAFVYDGKSTPKGLKGKAISFELEKAAFVLGGDDTVTTDKEAEDYNGLLFKDITLKTEAEFKLNHGAMVVIKGEADVEKAGSGFTVGDKASAKSKEIGTFKFERGAALKGAAVATTVPAAGTAPGGIGIGIYASATDAGSVSKWTVDGFSHVWADDKLVVNTTTITNNFTTNSKLLVQDKAAAILRVDYTSSSATYDKNAVDGYAEAMASAGISGKGIVTAGQGGDEVQAWFVVK